MALPEILVDVAFANNPGDSSPTWTTVSNDASPRTLELGMKRGRQDEFADSDVGQCKVHFRNQDRRFDPAYGSSPYSPNVIPVKQCRVRAIFSAVTYFLFQGDIEEWPQDWEGRTNTVTINILDAFSSLSEAELVLTRPDELSGARIGAVLDAAGWPAGKRSLDPGQWMTRAITADEGNALSMLKSYAKGEEGHIYIDGQGNFVFKDRHYRFKPPGSTSQVTLANVPGGGEFPFEDADVNHDKGLIKNDILISVKDQPTMDVFREDTTSKTKYRVRSHVEETYLLNPNDVTDKADYLLDRLKEPVIRVKEVILRPQMDNGLWPHALGREPGDKITVQVTPPAQAGAQTEATYECTIEGIEHQTKYGEWITKWRLAPADKNRYWLLGDSTWGVLGTTTKLAP